MKLPRLIPRSLSTQIALVMVAALLVASAVNFIFILGERSRAGLIETSGPAIARFIDVVAEVAETPASSTQVRPQGGFRAVRGGRFNVSNASPVDMRHLSRDGWLENRLTRALREADIKVLSIRAALRTIAPIERPPMRLPEPMPGDGSQPGFGGGPPPQRFAPNDGARPPAAGGTNDSPRSGPWVRESVRVAASAPPKPWRTILLSVQLPDQRWVSADFFAPEPPQGEFLRLAASTFVLFAFVLAATLWVASRLSRPFTDLRVAAAKVGAAAAPEEVRVSGPTDVRETLEAFNAMSRRVSQLLREKDVMLGALGHDLRTPLSSLRIRLETMEPESERMKAVKTIEETARLLEDILELARQGRSSEPAQTMDLSILVEDIVEDYSDTGAPVTMVMHQRAPASCRAILFRRLLRNLIDNALKYGGVAQVSVRQVANEIEIRVEDEGPGMSAEALAAATQPFFRGEASRSRMTGGAGLGLALADYIARNHGGRLILENRTPKGLAAIVRLPLAPPQSPPLPAVAG